MNRIMLDLETLGTSPGSLITSIGAVRFTDEAVVDTFYARVDAQSGIDAGLTVDVSTVLWWMQQSDAARAEFALPSDPLSQVLVNLSSWFDGDADEVWGNGAASDNVWLTAAYKACGLRRPWTHRADRCYRTLKALCPQVAKVTSGVEHNALDDAVSQANHLIAMLKEMRR